MFSVCVLVSPLTAGALGSSGAGVMPLMVLPFLVLMNDTKFVKNQTNAVVGNATLAILTVLGALMAVLVIPLEILGG